MMFVRAEIQSLMLLGGRIEIRIGKNNVLSKGHPKNLYYEIIKKFKKGHIIKSYGEPIAKR